MRIFVTALLTALLAAPGTQAQDQFEQQVRRQLEEAGKALKPQGFELTYQVYTGSLKKDAAQTVTFRLREGTTYALVGVCDEDCGDVDLRLADPAGREIQRDVEDDDTPVIELKPSRSGVYSLTIEMADCASEPCAFGVGVFATGIDEFERQVQIQIDAAAKELRGQGFKLTHQIWTGNLRQQEYEDVEFELDGRGTYLILGVCDTDCKDFDLELRDARGRSVDVDETDDDVPVVVVEVARRERYTVRATMARCADEPCRYGLGVMRK